MEKNNNKKITIEKLAEMINNGFEKTATKEQVQKIDDRLKNVEERLENVESLKARVKTLEESLEIE